MAIDEGLDTGPLYRCEAVPIGPDETAAELRARLAGLSAAMLVEGLADGLGPAQPQVGTPTYADKIEAEDLRLDWSCDAAQLHRVVRLGRAWTTWRGRRLLVLSGRVVSAPPAGGPAEHLVGEPGRLEGEPGRLEGEPGRLEGEPGRLEGEIVTAGLGGLQLVTVQPEGRGPMTAADWVRGARPRPGERLGE
jgi:methionyl-tRNA formyltransferase